MAVTDVELLAELDTRSQYNSRKAEDSYRLASDNAAAINEAITLYRSIRDLLRSWESKMSTDNDEIIDKLNLLQTQIERMSSEINILKNRI
jgi:hypothetical protein